MQITRSSKIPIELYLLVGENEPIGLLNFHVPSNPLLPKSEGFFAILGIFHRFLAIFHVFSWFLMKFWPFLA